MSVELETIELACNGRVPDAVQVGALSPMAVEGYRDIVAAPAQVFGVQGLVDVADEVDEVFEGFVAGAPGVVCV